MLTEEQRDEILRLVQECVAVGNEGGGKQAMALCDYLDSITVPEGWQVVPVEPTREMLSATSWPSCAATDYKHMLAAAPKPGDSSAPEKSRSQRLREAGFTRRPTWRSLPKDGDAASDKETGVDKCPDNLTPDGPVCPRCGGRRGPSGVDGGSWVHY